MKKELESYDYYYESSAQQAMMVANGLNSMQTVHPFNLEDNFLHILGKTTEQILDHIFVNNSR